MSLFNILTRNTYLVVAALSMLLTLQGCNKLHDKPIKAKATSSVDKSLAPKTTNNQNSGDQVKTTLSSITQIAIPTPKNADYDTVISLDVSPNGKWVVCWLGYDRYGDEVLFVSSTKEARWHRIAAGSGRGSWRPDSSMYVLDLYAKTEKVGGRIGLLRVPKMKVEEVKAPFHFMISPSWTSDGRYISVFCSERRSSGSRRAYNPDPPEHEFRYLTFLYPSGRVARQVPMIAGNCEPVSWSPNGTRGAFVGNIQKAFGNGFLCIISRRTGQRKWDEGDEAHQPNVSRIEWLNNEWLIEPASSLVTKVAGLKVPKKWYAISGNKDSYLLSKDLGRPDVTISAWISDKSGGFYGVTQESTNYDTYYVERSELWYGRNAPKPHLTKKIAALPFTLKREDVIADFDPAHGWLWMLSADGKSLRTYPYTTDMPGNKTNDDVSVDVDNT